MTTIHIVPNAHLDPAWLWDWREGLNESIATCRTIADLMDENPDLTFTRGEAFLYQHIEKYEPKLFVRIRSLFRKGRWEIAGGTMLQPDTNLGSGEAYVRQFLYGQAYFRDRFGFVPEIVYQVDSFGHAAGLPSIYRAAGCRFAVQCRPSQKEQPTGSRIFRWRGPDNAEILTANLESYGLEFETQDPLFTFSARLKRAKEQMPKGLNDWLLLVGLGNHGGGLNRQLLKEIRYWFSNPPEGYTLCFSTLRHFFAAIEKKTEIFPVIKGELQYYARGCYTSAAPVKNAYRAAENKITCAERWASVADILGKQSYPAEKIKEVWLDILFNQFHDILPGSSVERVCQEALDHLGRAKHQARWIINNSALPVFLNIDTSKHAGVPILLFNPHGSPFEGPVEVEWCPEYRPLGPLGPNGERRIVKSVIAVGPNGETPPTQFLPTDCGIPAEWRFKTCFEAKVPAGGYSVYWLQRSQKPSRAKSDIVTGHKPEIFIANQYLRVEYRKDEAGIRVFDRCGKKAWFKQPAGVGITLSDPGDSWGTGIDSWNEILARFKPTEIRILESGPVKASMLLLSRCRNSELIQEFSIYRESRQVHCQARLNWNEPGCLCKLEFPINLDHPHCRFAGPYAVVERPANCGEVPANQWAALTDEAGFGVGVANKGQYGFDVIDNCLRMSLVRSPWYGSMLIPKRNAPYEKPFMDIGSHVFEYIMAPADEIERAARKLNMPIQITLGFSHRGDLPITQSIISVLPEKICLAAFKKAEDGCGWIIRLWESTGTVQTGTVSILGKKVAAVSLLPWQLLTLRLVHQNKKWTLKKEELTEPKKILDGKNYKR